jgi:hypothetical protein
VVLTPQQFAPAPQAQARADDGYIYPADGSSTEQRYPAPRGRGVYNAEAYGQQRQYYSYGDRAYGSAPAPQYYQPRSYYQPRGFYSYQD